jgi:anti-sigma regulatory factor (Ser/Thr protein kinase)
MGELRAAIVALSDLDLPPDEILTRLHDLASRPTHEPAAASPREAADQNWPATCLYAVYDPVTRICTLASASHPSPALLHADGEVEVMDVPQGPPLGQDIAQYTVTQRTLPLDSTVLLYNTALLGRDPHPGATRIPVDLLARVATTPHDSLQATCDAIVDALAPKHPDQDAVLLLARTRALDAAHTAAWTLPNEPHAAAEARRHATAQLNDWDLAELADDAALIVSELVTNAVRYAEGPIELRLIRDRVLICEITDDSSTAPQLRRANETDEGGRGLFITAQLTDRWGIRPARRGKTIWTEQHLPAAHGSV